ncbi:MAG: hypothetical protein V4713_02685 [Pseudomonadota bacterium]
MGLSDRDYMHERRPKEQMWERSQQVSTLQSNLWMILTWISILFLLYKSFLWWESSKKPVAAINPSIGVAVTETVPVESKRIYRHPTPQQGQQNSANRSAPVDFDNRTVTKCMVNGQVIFTDSDCPTGSKVSSVTINTAYVGTVAPQMPEIASPQVQDQSVTTNFPTEGTVGKASTRNAECSYLDEQIKLIDSLARQPQSAQTQDNLSTQRKRFRSRQYELHC